MYISRSSKLHYYLDLYKKSYIENTTISSVLKYLDVEHGDYYWTLDTSEDLDKQIHLKRDTRACFVRHDTLILTSTNYFDNAVTYMAAYFSKSAQETSEALRQAKEEIQSQKLKIKEVM